VPEASRDTSSGTFAEEWIIPEKSADKAGVGEVAEWNRVGPPETE